MQLLLKLLRTYVYTVQWCFFLRFEGIYTVVLVLIILCAIISTINVHTQFSDNSTRTNQLQLVQWYEYSVSVQGILRNYIKFVLLLHLQKSFKKYAHKSTSTYTVV